MMNVGVVVEGQVSWDLWRRFVTTVEDLGFESLWRSDHLFSLSGDRTRDVLDPYVAFALAAELTERVRFGPLVSPITFRHPSILARMAAQIDALSGGRFVAGVGAGWNVPEHTAFGIPLPPLRERMDRLDESIRVTKALWSDGPATFDGRYYQLQDAECHPKPVQRPLPVVVGGMGERRTLRIVAELADEWNSFGITIDNYKRKTEVLEAHCDAVGRDPAEITHSQMSNFIVGKNDRDIRRHLGNIGRTLGMGPSNLLTEARSRGWLVGTPSQLVEEIGKREEAGISRLMLEYPIQYDFEVLELLATEVLPQVQG